MTHDLLSTRATTPIDYIRLASPSLLFPSQNLAEDKPLRISGRKSKTYTKQRKCRS